VEPVAPQFVLDSLEDLAADVKVSAVRVGMLGSGQIAQKVAEFLERAQFPNVVLDTVLNATSGASLLDDEGKKALLEKLVPLASVVTPNAEEAAALTGTKSFCVDDMKEAANRFHQLGARRVVITGGHLDKATDLLSMKAGDVQIFKSDRLDSTCTHGTGCAFATAIACQLAQGRTLPEAVLLAKAYVTAAIGNGYAIGKGIGPVNHMYRMKNHPGGFVKKSASGNV
ncbi:MAG TPA: bifunctional hydroxymethylpyrimidine kinase/phosphomethylpyrimidine kinase, partial [Terriglobales bacterium]|nr:bifunctional hydroxymethylpyrimidine kinase/phosphomethylpyrimidine kinase [Terriglobales bacterium]